MNADVVDQEVQRQAVERPPVLVTIRVVRPLLIIIDSNLKTDYQILIIFGRLQIFLT